MTEISMAAVERLRKGEEDGEDWLRERVREVVQVVMEA